MAFTAFCLCASGLYLINDLLDLPEDRQHPQKRHRPFASGALSPERAVFLIPLLLSGAAIMTLALPSGFAALLGCYLVLMLVYSLKLRDIAYFDVATLGLGYALRVVGGATAADLTVSPWLLVFCFLFFAGLAVLKRYADLVAHRAVRGDEGCVHAYSAKDGTKLAILAASDNGAALLLLVYHYEMVGDFQGRHVLLWGVPLLLVIWLIHMWRMARHGRIADDPVVFALKDRTSLVIGAASAIALLAAA
jgi:4-hydroxybenzoate polyprenyltransferase